MNDADAKFYAMECERLVDDRALRHFAVAMSTKLDKKRQEGRSGWHDPAQCTIESLRELLRSHVEKGDMVDIANFAMMIWHRERVEGRTTLNPVAAWPFPSGKKP